ncbi:hypothetical protein MK489_00395 [Myxococcota bacterium]|nr:hypothetical protein [Myxococcota bacterium]
MGKHPLIEHSIEKTVKQAAAFKQAAAELTGERLAEWYQQELVNAPNRTAAGKKYFVQYNSKLANARRPGRDGEHMAIALTAHCRELGAGIALPGEVLTEESEEGTLRFVHPLVPLKSAQADKALGTEDPNYGVDRVDAIGVAPEGRLAVVEVRFLAPDANRVGVGDTPLRALLEGLANCAIAEANRNELRSEIAAASGVTVADDSPVLVVLGSSRYWELCRKREAQKGAAWIREMERLATEIERDIGVTVMFLSLRLTENPGFSYPDGSPVLDAPAHLATAWERGAGKLKPKPKPRTKKTDPAEMIVEADLSRPIRPYSISQAFQSGDRIEHPTLGLGVVQGGSGPGKIKVLFGEKTSLLVHERPVAGSG